MMFQARSMLYAVMFMTLASPFTYAGEREWVRMRSEADDDRELEAIKEWAPPSSSVRDPDAYARACMDIVTGHRPYDEP